VRTLLFLWRVLPFPDRARGLIMWAYNTHFVAGAAAFIRDDDGRVLLFKHTYRRRHPWGMPGGYIGRGERPEEALMRELREEAGLIIAVEGIALVELDPVYRNINLVYRCRVTGGTFQPSAEVSACAYVASDALPSGVMPFQRRQIARLAASGAGHGGARA